jgi:hypothetical protein
LKKSDEVSVKQDVKTNPYKVDLKQDVKKILVKERKVIHCV